MHKGYTELCKAIKSGLLPQFFLIILIIILIIIIIIIVAVLL